jgi:hypothetical protein
MSRIIFMRESHSNEARQHTVILEAEHCRSQLD